MNKIDWRSRFSERVKQSSRRRDMYSVKFIEVSKDSNSTLLRIEFKDRTIGYLKKNQVSNQLESIQFLNKTKTRSYLPEVFTSGVRNLKGEEFEYDPRKDKIHFEGTISSFGELFKLFHEHGHSFESDVLGWHSTVSRAKLALITMIESDKLQEVDRDPKELLLSKASKFADLIGPFRDITKEQLVQILIGKLDASDIKYILQSEFDATVFALEQSAQVLNFFGLVEGSEAFEEIMQYTLDLGVETYSTYIDGYIPYEGFDIMAEQIERHAEWKERFEWQKSNNLY